MPTDSLSPIFDHQEQGRLKLKMLILQEFMWEVGERGVFRKQHRVCALIFLIVSLQSYNRQVMSQQEEEEDHHHKKYSKISLKVRLESMQKRQILIDLVIGKGDSLTKTSKKLNIKLSTAKLILRKYRKTGVLFNKNMNARDKKRGRIENQSMKRGLSSAQIKRQQVYYGEGSNRQEREKEEHLPQGMVIPSVYYPLYQGNWFAYPWYRFPFHL